MDNDKQQPPAPAYRGATVQTRGLQDNLINTGAQKAGKSAASAQSIKFGGQTNNVMTLETDAAAPNSKGAQKVEIQVIGGDVAAPIASAVKVNEVSHTTVRNSSPQKVISQLTETIASYSDAVHTELDEANLSISGTAFVGDYHAVHFKIDVTSDADGNTHFEFLRTSGSALAAAKFLGIVNRVFADAKVHQKSDSGNLMAVFGAFIVGDGEFEGRLEMAKGTKDALVSAVKTVQSELAATKEVELKQREFADVDCAAVLKKLEA